MLEAWVGRAERRTRQESGFGVCGEEGVSGPRGELLGGVVSARSVGREGREGDKARIRVWSVR